ncbi:MAG TPA: hypothetical protein VFH73_12390 [Polyangia bacterium]|jgi:hypothetical protein|nr:hypothetical protein [Polyangia bacterium]
MRNPAVIIVMACTLCAAALACREVAPEVTAVRIVVKPPPATFNQIEFSLDDSNSQSILRTTRPDAGAPLAGDQDLVVYLSDNRAGTDVTCAATALLNQVRIATGSKRITLSLRHVVNCVVPLSGGDGGTDANSDGASDPSAGGDAAPGADALEAAPETPPDLPSEETRDAPLLDVTLPDLGLGI